MNIALLIGIAVLGAVIGWVVRGIALSQREPDGWSEHDQLKAARLSIKGLEHRIEDMERESARKELSVPKTYANHTKVPPKVASGATLPIRFVRSKGSRLHDK